MHASYNFSRLVWLVYSRTLRAFKFLSILHVSFLLATQRSTWVPLKHWNWLTSDQLVRMNQVFWPCSLLEVYRGVWERRVYILLILYVHDYRHQGRQGIRRGIQEYGMWQYKHGRGMVGEDFIVAYSLHWQRWVTCDLSHYGYWSWRSLGCSCCVNIICGLWTQQTKVSWPALSLLHIDSWFSLIHRLGV